MIEYEDNKEFKIAIEKMLADKTLTELNPLRENESVTIFSLLCIRTNKQDEYVQGKGPTIVCRKIPGPFQALTGGHYLVIADYYFWNHADELQQRAKLYHALMHIDIDKNDEGELKLGTRKPNVQVFTSEVARFGAHTEGLLDIREALKQSAKQFAETLKPKK